MKVQNREVLNWTIIDIGASTGLFANFIMNLSTSQERYCNIRVFAVEPIPDIAAKIGERHNLKVIQKAIVAFDLIPSTGTKDFNIMKNTELSSFLEINPNLDKNIWKEHTSSLQVEKVIKVPCITLESLMVDNKITRVDFIKIDTQGTDFEVLLSAGKEMSKVRSCSLEFPYSTEVAIYSNEKSLGGGYRDLRRIWFFINESCPEWRRRVQCFFLKFIVFN